MTMMMNGCQKKGGLANASSNNSRAEDGEDAPPGGAQEQKIRRNVWKASMNVGGTEQ